MKMTLFTLITLFGIFILISGCDKPLAPSDTTYIEIVDETPGNFHEIILTGSGEFFDKNGTENLSTNTHVKTGSISLNLSLNIINQTKLLLEKGENCNLNEYYQTGRVKEIIVFDGKQVKKACFKTQEFDELFAFTSTSVKIPSLANNNFFIHLINSKPTSSIDYHLHPSGLVIITNYDLLGEISLASIKRITKEQVTQLQQIIPAEIFSIDNNCSMNSSNYEYLEIEHNDKYTYYYNCSKSPQKEKFFSDTLAIMVKAQ
ncbi:MAG: hypothetical protein NTY48_00770 [Candidatus Diapherotrites archaeon]|nr:hypothetical protein [Candidatus Diapherotrites archaeon]